MTALTLPICEEDTVNGHYCIHPSSSLEIGCFVQLSKLSILYLYLREAMENWLENDCYLLWEFHERLQGEKKLF